MAKHRISPFQMGNLVAALAAWQEVNPETVELCWWRSARSSSGRWVPAEAKDSPDCGSAACFGGWLPYMPHFKALGVTRGKTGEPIWQGNNIHTTSRELFGWWLFGASGDQVYPEYPGVSDLARYLGDPNHWKQVCDRLEWAIANSEVVA